MNNMFVLNNAFLEEHSFTAYLFLQLNEIFMLSVSISVSFVEVNI